MFSRVDEIKAQSLLVNAQYFLMYRDGLKKPGSEQQKKNISSEIHNVLEEIKNIADHFESYRKEPEHQKDD